MAQGIIQQANPSKSGKTLSVQIGGQWYTTKHFELQNMVGQGITFQTSQSEFNGTVMNWLNDYTADNVSTTPSGQAFDQAHAQQQTSPPMAHPSAPPTAAHPSTVPQTPSVDREASIVAQALTKSMSGLDTPQKAYTAYCELYHLVLSNPVPTKATTTTTAENYSGEPYSDSIPF